MNNNHCTHDDDCCCNMCVIPGPQGPAGPQGPRGVRGLVGPTGPAGANGLAATISVESSIRIPFDDNPYVVNVGTSQNAILKFGIPSGTPGERGPQGEAGPTGPQVPVI